LKGRKDPIKVLLSIYGVPLRVGGSTPSDEDKAALSKLQQDMEPLQTRQKKLQDEIAGLEAKAKKDPSEELTKKIQELRKERDAIPAKLRPLEMRRNFLNHAESHASVDSELMLLWWDNYELRRWQVNPMYFQVPDKDRQAK